MVWVGVSLYFACGTFLLHTTFLLSSSLLLGLPFSLFSCVVATLIIPR